MACCRWWICSGSTRVKVWAERLCPAIRRRLRSVARTLRCRRALAMERCWDTLSTNSAPNYAVGVNVNIPLRNRVAQADQARSQMELRQSEMRLQQLYTQLRIQVINAQYALTNDRANVIAAQTAREFNAQSLDARTEEVQAGCVDDSETCFRRSGRWHRAKTTSSRRRQLMRRIGHRCNRSWRIRWTGTGFRWWMRRAAR